MSEHPEDICYCGDYRRDHPNNGACALNGLGHGTISGDGWEDKCMQFRLCGGEKGILVADADQYPRTARRRRESMTEEERLTILAIKGAISELPPEHEERCNALVAHIQRMTIEAGSPVGELAVALVAAMLQAAIEE